jgi:hypothetical protein
MQSQDSVADESWSGPTSVVIPSSLVVLAEKKYLGCRSLETVTFESGSSLERIEKSAFSKSGLKSIMIPSSVVYLGESSFYECKSLESVTFESGSRLEYIDRTAFSLSGLKSIVIPSSVSVWVNRVSMIADRLNLLHLKAALDLSILMKRHFL